jgi:hypothetical protein
MPHLEHAGASNASKSPQIFMQGSNQRSGSSELLSTDDDDNEFKTNIDFNSPSTTQSKKKQNAGKSDEDYSPEKPASVEKNNYPSPLDLDNLLGPSNSQSSNHKSPVVNTPESQQSVDYPTLNLMNSNSSEHSIFVSF